MNEKHKKTMYICLAILAVLYFGRHAVTYVAQQRAVGRHPVETVVDPPKIVPAAVPEVPAIPASFQQLAGIWEGRGLLKDRGFCDLRVELKEDGPGKFSAYPRFACNGLQGLSNPNDRNVVENAMLHTNPEAAILDGKIENNAIHFKVIKTIGTDINGCTVSDFTLTPFGNGVLASEWLEGTCQGGNMLLQRTKP